MSAAPECPPEVFIPARARVGRGAHGLVRNAPRGGRPSTLRALPPGQLEADSGSDWSTTSWHRNIDANSRSTVTYDDRRDVGAANIAERPTTARAKRSAIDEAIGSGVAVRLTRRGAVFLVAFAALTACALSAVAWASAPSTAPSMTTPARITVQPGDSLWSVAVMAAPNSDPRAEVDKLSALNNLTDGAVLSPGQILRTR
jgi:LysM repeat protein